MVRFFPRQKIKQFSTCVEIRLANLCEISSVGINRLAEVADTGVMVRSILAAIR